VAAKKKAAPAKKGLKETVAQLRSRLARAEAKAKRWKERSGGFRAAAANAEARTKKLEKRLKKAQRQPAPALPADRDRVPPPVRATASSPDSTWTVARLRAEARSRGVTGYSRKTKVQLLADLDRAVHVSPESGPGT
jgi:lysophospholipase